MTASHPQAMPPRFDVPVEIDINASPLEVFETATARSAAWLWDLEPATAAGETTGMGATVTDFEPGVKYRNHMEGENGWFNTLTFDIAPQGEGARLNYLHEGVFPDPYELQLDACTKHTDLYIKTLAAAAEHFAGEPCTYLSVDAAAASSRDGLARLLAALNLGAAAVGDTVEAQPAGHPGVRLTGTVDYRTEHFFGVRGDGCMFRVFDRGAWGGPVTIAWHLFEGTPGASRAWNVDDLNASWAAYLGELYGEVSESGQ
ncbi:hypothetical protein JT358_04215 [Micrococcales bacterium 31B]|nr:hypothetical protein [Micrococcales bacterium 31B]